MTYILSEPDSDWSGLTGRIRSELVEKFLPPQTDADVLLFCACGPTAFTQEAMR